MDKKIFNIKHLLLIGCALLFGAFQQANAACNVTNQPAANQIQALIGTTLAASQVSIKQISGATNVRVNTLTPPLCLPISTYHYAPDEISILATQQGVILSVSC